ncbi:MAG: thiamine-phosphate kinase [candidate division WOR-3 bacterium]
MKLGAGSSIADIGELGLIDRIRQRMKVGGRGIKVGIGDDCCVLKDGTVISIDSFVEGIHFDLGYFDYYSLGWRLMAAALSDLAAMAASPLVSLISLMLPSKMKIGSIDNFYRGAEKLAMRFNCPIGGGDTDSANRLVISIAVVGKTDKPKLRSAAQPGDLLYITGYPGLSEVGRLVLKKRWSTRRFISAINKHLTPLPRINEALRLKRSIKAMIDTSDGLSTDACHIARESRARVVIDWSKVPVHKEVRAFCSLFGLKIKDFIMAAGEDFELLFTSRRGLPGRIGSLKLSQIGYITKGNGLFVKDGGKIQKVNPTGYEHLR